MKSAVFVSVALPLSSSITPVSELILINSDNGNCGGINANSIGTRGSADGNLNQGISHGDKLALCFKFGGSFDPGSPPIADLNVRVGDKSLPECEKGFEPISTQLGANGDLNQGKHGKYIRLCQTLDYHYERAVTSVILQSDQHCPSGFEVATSNNGDNNLNQHGHSDGKNIFLCFLKQDCDQVEQDITGYWLPLQEYSKGDTFTHHIGMSVSHTNSWTHTVTDSISKSHTKVRIDVKGSKSQLSSNTKTVSDLVSNAFTYGYQEDFTSTHTFSKNGHAWQYVTEVPITCGTTHSIYSPAVVLTTDSKVYPCCYPNRFHQLDDGSKCLTDDDILPNGKDRGCTAHKGLDLDGAEVV